jgi:hypothetical protein
MKIGPGFFFARTFDKNSIKGEDMTRHEQTHLKITLLLVKDWDGFQAAMRQGLQKNQILQKDTGREYSQ